MNVWHVILFTGREGIRRGPLIAYFILSTATIVVYALAMNVVNQEGDLQLFSLFPTATAQAVLEGIHRQTSSFMLLLGVFATAGLMTSWLESGSVDVILSKPLTRPMFLLGRAFGCVVSVAANVIYFAVGIWLVFGMKLGMWMWGLLASSVCISLVFACLFGITVLFAVLTRNTALSIIGTFVVYYFSSWFLETREQFLFRLWDSEFYRGLLNLLYYLIPQFGAMLKSSVQLISVFGNPSAASWNFEPFLFSFLSSGFFYGVAALFFRQKDF